MFVYRYNVPPDSHGAAAAGTSASGDATAGGGGVVANMTYVHQELPLTRHLWRQAADQPSASTSQQQELLQRQHSLDADPATAARMAVAVRAAAAASAASHAGGGVNVLLRYPVVVGHEIGPDSPIRDWITPDGMLKVGLLRGCAVLLAGARRRSKTGVSGHPARPIWLLLLLPRS
jgi:hypothetical protein